MNFIHAFIVSSFVAYLAIWTVEELSLNDYVLCALCNLQDYPGTIVVCINTNACVHS